ncbi:hypothetical protein FA15DRAFT_656140 [Coprinopsis marcescibilis]|uniref:Uncharacterized protein n=1 Tax=Coprinopsis marcescibilis TaxID=230819 RepID=A0A5C3L7G5_COPMA|nr:hypothetical protein FA15DRAFT_656140 [Coprinopsis marcescibilis]
MPFSEVPFSWLAGDKGKRDGVYLGLVYGQLTEWVVGGGDRPGGVAGRFLVSASRGASRRGGFDGLLDEPDIGYYMVKLTVWQERRWFWGAAMGVAFVWFGTGGATYVSDLLAHALCGRVRPIYPTRSMSSEEILAEHGVLEAAKPCVVVTWGSVNRQVDVRRSRAPHLTEHIDCAVCSLGEIRARLARQLVHL